MFHQTSWLGAQMYVVCDNTKLVEVLLREEPSASLLVVWASVIPSAEAEARLFECTDVTDMRETHQLCLHVHMASLRYQHQPYHALPH